MKLEPEKNDSKPFISVYLLLITYFLVDSQSQQKLSTKIHITIQFLLVYWVR